MNIPPMHCGGKVTSGERLGLAACLCHNGCMFPGKSRFLGKSPSPWRSRQRWKSTFRNSWAAAIVLSVFFISSLWASDMPRKPKVRAITAFVRIDPEHYPQQIQPALDVLRHAKAAFEQGGYEVQTVRITTQPFPQYIRNLSQEEAVRLFKSLDDLSAKESFTLNIGPAAQRDGDNPAQIELLGRILATTQINASLIVAGEDGVHWKSVRSAAQVMKYLEENSPRGENNFGFAATAMLLPYAPFYPGSYHDGAGRQFSVGLEGGSLVADVFSAANGDLGVAADRLAQELGAQAKILEAIATKIQSDTGWTYMGLDATPAPGLDSSIGAAFENLTGSKFGSSGTLTTARIITEAVRSVPVKRVGFSGLMLPPLEDPVLARRWSEGTYNLDSLLAYSAVCGTGLDTVPLPGDVSQAQLERIIGDVASLAVKWHKPLTARLIPAPGKKPGEGTEFASAYLTNTVLKPLP
jgi:uncharacterized protein